MIHGTLDMVGSDLQNRYQKQFMKLIAYIDGRYMARDLNVRRIWNWFWTQVLLGR